MGLLSVISVELKAAALLLFSGVLAPAIGFGLKRLVGGWSTFGGGPFAILDQAPRRGGRAAQSLDPAIQAAEVRQMLLAKAERQRRRGETALDVDAEAERLLAATKAAAPARIDEQLRAEVRQLVIVRNERRARQGLKPLDVPIETERQLADLRAHPS